MAVDLDQKKPEQRDDFVSVPLPEAHDPTQQDSPLGAPPPYGLAVQTPSHASPLRAPADVESQGLSPATVRTAEGLPASYYASPTARPGGTSTFFSFRRMHPCQRCMFIFIVLFSLSVVIGIIVGVSLAIKSAVEWNEKFHSGRW